MSSAMETSLLPLPGLHGNNPLGFLAALGVLVALDHAGIEARMHWTEDVVPTPLLTTSANLDDVVQSVLRLNKVVVESLTRHFPKPPNISEKDSGLKLKATEVREILEATRKIGLDDRLWLSLLSEDARQETDPEWSKPTALSLTSGREKVISIAKNILEDTASKDIDTALYSMTIKKDGARGRTMRWDVSDNAQHALLAYNPAEVEKKTSLGAEALAILGLNCVPCFTENNRARTQGVVKGRHRSTEYKHASFCWPLWRHSLRLQVVKTILAQITTQDHTKRPLSYPSWGITAIFESAINDLQSGRQSFRYPSVVWSEN